MRREEKRRKNGKDPNKNKKMKNGGKEQLKEVSTQCMYIVHTHIHIRTRAVDLGYTLWRGCVNCRDERIKVFAKQPKNGT